MNTAAETSNQAIIGVYETHQQAVEALKLLSEANFPMKHVALIGRGEAVKEIDGVHTWEETTIKGAELGTFLGGALGLLTGVGLLTIPGLGVMYIAGTLAGAALGTVGGASLGSLGGTVIGSILGAVYGNDGAVEGIKDPEDAQKYEEYLKAGKYIIIVHGPESEVKEGIEILQNHKEYNVLGTHLIH